MRDRGSSRKLGCKALQGPENLRTLGSKLLWGREHFTNLCSTSLPGRENWRRLGSRSLRGHLAWESAARSHFEIENTWEDLVWSVERTRDTRLEVISRSTKLSKTAERLPEVEKLQENKARSHFEVSSRTWRKLDTFGYRGHSSRESSARGHFKVTWIKKTRLEVSSRSRKLNRKGLEVMSMSREPGSKSFRSWDNLGSSTWSLFKLKKTRETIAVTPRSRELDKNSET
jgi:hypothetical protein